MYKVTKENQTATITLDRPDKHNAFDDVMIAELTALLKKIDNDDSVRVVVLAANGKSFSAGGDLAWMQRMVDYSEEENKQDALKLAKLMQTLDQLSKPTSALVQGPA